MEPTPTQNNNMVPPAEGAMPQEINPTPQAVPPAPDTTPPITPQPPEKPKNRKRSIIILSVILGILLITAGVFAFLYFSNNSNGDEPQQESSEDTQEEIVEEPEEVEITDQLLKNDLDNKIAILHQANSTNSQFRSGLLGTDFLYGDKEFSEVQKVTLLFNSIKPDYPLGYKEVESAVLEQGYVDDNAQALRERLIEGVRAETMAKEYKDVFGQNITHGSINGQTSCPKVYYNAEYGFYYDAGLGCGGTTPFVENYYKNKYTTDDEHAYVYINVATINYEDNKIYCDHINAETFSTNPPAICGDFTGEEEFIINDSNYQDYAEYRFIFNKADDGTYYFNKVEKVSS